MKHQRKHRLPVGYKLTNEIKKTNTFEPFLWKNKATKARAKGTSVLHAWGPRRSRKPVTLAKP